MKVSAKEWSATLDFIVDLVYIRDKDFRIVKVNKAFAELFNKKPQELVGKFCYEVVHGTKEPLSCCLRTQALKIPKPIAKEFFEPHLDIHLKLIILPVFSKKSEDIGFVHIARDITERKNTQEELENTHQKLKAVQEQLIQSSKMAVMGRLMAGISHELNQPLTGIKSFSQSILMNLDEDSSIRKDLERIEEQADRMGKLVQSVCLFAGKSEFKAQEVDVNLLLENSLLLLNSELKLHNIYMVKSLERNLPKISGNSNELQQVFINLLTNAWDAISSLNNSEKGEISVKTCLSEDKENIEVTFLDAGCGIPEKNIENIFTPFFTTKTSGGGIGLGLAIVYRIIETHKGKIEVKSSEGEGASFKIALPVI